MSIFKVITETTFLFPLAANDVEWKTSNYV